MVPKPDPEPSPIHYLKGDQPYSDRTTIEGILKETPVGPVRIADPYVGLGTLDMLMTVPDTCSVRVLTAYLVPKADQVERAIRSLVKERPSFEFRRTIVRGMHDRYIIDDSRMLILGHGLQDVGAKESFVVRLDVGFAEDIVRRATDYFDQRWKTATSLP